MKSMDKKSPVAVSPLVSDSPPISGLEDNTEIDNKSIMNLMIELNDKTNRRIDMMNESINTLATLFR